MGRIGAESAAKSVVIPFDDLMTGEPWNAGMQLEIRVISKNSRADGDTLLTHIL